MLARCCSRGCGTAAPLATPRRLCVRREVGGGTGRVVRPHAAAAAPARLTPPAPRPRMQALPKTSLGGHDNVGEALAKLSQDPSASNPSDFRRSLMGMMQGMAAATQSSKEMAAKVAGRGSLPGKAAAPGEAGKDEQEDKLSPLRSEQQPGSSTMPVRMGSTQAPQAPQAATCIHAWQTWFSGAAGGTARACAHRVACAPAGCHAPHAPHAPLPARRSLARPHATRTLLMCPCAPMPRSVRSAARPSRVTIHQRSWSARCSCAARAPLT